VIVFSQELPVISTVQLVTSF